MDILYVILSTVLSSTPLPPITTTPASSPAEGVQTHPGQAVLAGDFTKVDDGLG